jgi:DNA-binding transcriptional regulator YiaG
MVGMAPKRKGDKPAGYWPKKLRAIRRKYDLTQKEAAARTQVALRTWINWEADWQEPSTLAQILLQNAFPDDLK